MTCPNHAEGELRSFIELRKTDNHWEAAGFICGQVHPEIVVKTAGGAHEALTECSYLLGPEVAAVEQILDEDDV